MICPRRPANPGARHCTSDPTSSHHRGFAPVGQASSQRRGLRRVAAPQSPPQRRSAAWLMTVDPLDPPLDSPLDSALTVSKSRDNLYVRRARRCVAPSPTSPPAELSRRRHEHRVLAVMPARVGRATRRDATRNVIGASASSMLAPYPGRDGTRRRCGDDSERVGPPRRSGSPLRLTDGRRAAALRLPMLGDRSPVSAGVFSARTGSRVRLAAGPGRASGGPAAALAGVGATRPRRRGARRRPRLAGMRAIPHCAWGAGLEVAVVLACRCGEHRACGTRRQSRDRSHGGCSTIGRYDLR